MTTASAPIPTLLLARTQRSPRFRSLRVFFALVRRDGVVTMSEFGTAMAQGIVQPFFLLFIFGKLLIKLGFAEPQYSAVLFPGILALVTVFTALQSSALPLVLDFAFAAEIEDRLTSPVPTTVVALEKITFAALRALTAAVLIIPIGLLVLGSIPVRAAGIPLLVLALVLGAVLASALGIALGTAVRPNKIMMMFSLIITPLLFTGCAQYPWPLLAKVRWFQVVSSANPLTYVSEVVRSAMVPKVPHLALQISLPLLVGLTVVTCAVAVRGFVRRAVP
jgi:ABC-2 type transport system permease protein